ncbi:MAG: protease family protein [Verrucomicrobiota bacterium]|jgi:membrane protease YdiL (CAAX protease family)
MLSGKPWKLEAVLFFFMGVLSCVFLGNLAAWTFHVLFPGLKVADRRFYDFLMGAAGLQVALLVLAHHFLKQHGLGWREFLRASRIPLRILLIRAVLVALLAVPIALFLNEISGAFIGALRSKPAETQPTMQVLEISYTWGRRALFSLAAMIVAPITEEILFRGVLYAAIKEAGYPKLALFGTSIAFAAIHMSWMTLAPLTFFAIIITLLYERTGSLVAAIVAHATFNAANIACYFIAHDLLHWGSR